VSVYRCAGLGRRSSNPEEVTAEQALVFIFRTAVPRSIKKRANVTKDISHESSASA
jgi:hypothetical protein